MEPAEELHQSLAKLFLSSDYSDLTIRCGHDVHRVHKAIVCPRTEFFAAAERFGGKEAAIGEVTLKDDDPDLIKRMLQYLYTLDYDSAGSNDNAEIRKSGDNFGAWSTTFSDNPVGSYAAPIANEVDSSPEEPTDASEDVVNEEGVIEVLSPHGGDELDLSILEGLVPDEGGKIRDADGEIIGELVTGDLTRILRFGYFADNQGRINNKKGQCIGHVRVLPESDAINKFCGNFSGNLVLHASMYSVADKFNIPGLRTLAQNKFRADCLTGWNTKDFSLALHVVYTTTVDEDKGLRDILIDTISKHMQLLKKPEIEAAMLEFHGLAFGLLKVKHL